MSAPAWKTAGNLAGAWLVPVGVIESTFNHVGLRGPSVHTRGTGDQQAWSPAAVELVERELRSRGRLPEELLRELRSVPPVGAWAVLDSTQDPENGEWRPDGCRPTEWHHTQAQAMAAAAARPVPTCVAKVIDVDGGWSVGDYIQARHGASRAADS